MILTCGHSQDDFFQHYRIMTKEWTRENNKAIGYKTVCLSCYNEYAKDKLIFHTEDEAMEWLLS